MKKIFALLLVLMPLMLVAQDYDFAKTIGGNTLYFYITSTGGKHGATVEVTYPGPSEEKPWKGFSKPVGQVSIPEFVTPPRSENPEDDDTTIYTVTSIRYFAFKGCNRIKKLVLPRSIKDMGEGAFEGCNKIAEIVTSADNPPLLNESSFDGVDLDIPVRIPEGSYETYKQAVGWRMFTQLTEY